MTQAANLAQLANKVNSSGQLDGATGITGTVPTATNATNATNSTNATRITNSGGWSITPSGTILYFNYNGTNVAKLDSSGNLVVLGDVTAYGTI
jgi:hypothetical protein